MVIYFFFAVLAAIILYPLSLLAVEKHYESDGYDV